MNSLSERFWSKTNIGSPSECWEWRGTRTDRGYGRFYASTGSVVAAHRMAYELAIGPIPAGLVMDHLCRNRACVNPEHLEPVTNAENLRRGVSFSAMNTQKTHCPRGHEYSGANLRMNAGKRHCRTCGNAHAARQWAAKVAARST